MTWESNDELYHFGIKGQKWGVRNYQNEDGTLTTAGKTRYSRGKQINKEINKIANSEFGKMMGSSRKLKNIEKAIDKSERDKDWDTYEKKYNELDKLEDSFYKQSHKKAKELVIKKYGDTAIEDVKYYKTVRRNIANFIKSVGAATVIGAFTVKTLSNKR